MPFKAIVGLLLLLASDASTVVIAPSCANGSLRDYVKLPKNLPPCHASAPKSLELVCAGATTIEVYAAPSSSIGIAPMSQAGLIQFYTDRATIRSEDLTIFDEFGRVLSEACVADSARGRRFDTRFGFVLLDHQGKQMLSVFYDRTSKDAVVNGTTKHVTSISDYIRRRFTFLPT